MELFMLVLYVIPPLVSSITISSNGNSPEIKMLGGMMVDVQKGFTPMASTHHETVISPNYKKSRRLVNNSSKLSINERYRRLIPYMTFYYANDLATPTTENYDTKNIEVEKAEIIEGTTIGHPTDRQPKKIVFSSHRNIPRYQGNRLTQYNIASANPTKLLYKEIPVHHNSPKVTANYNPLLSEHTIVQSYDYDRPLKPIIKSPSVPFSAPTRKPYINLYNNNDDSANIRYYLSEKDHSPKFKLVPYEQTPPVQLGQQIDNFYDLPRKPVPVLIPKEQLYIKPRPTRPLFYDNVNIQQLTPRKQPAIISENYYEKRHRPVIVQPIIQSGFKPIPASSQATESPTLEDTPLPYFESEKQQPVLQSYETSTLASTVNNFRPNYYQYVVEQQTYKPELEELHKPIVEQPTYKPVDYSPANTVTLGDLINSLQLNKSIPNPITRENVGSSIRTLLQVLNALKAVPHQNELEHSIISTPKPYLSPTVVIEPTEKSVIEITSTSALPIQEHEELHEEPYLAPVKTPSQHLDDYPSAGGTSQQFPLPITSDDEGGTPGRPGQDYPILTTIPHTSFNCKTQRYKGFFADPETRCQVWHYCDLNGGQASFLCPNGTIFSQAALTCDWWFNVRCSATTQLYVLNESLYKFILPHAPKFPEDYSGPLVDKYLTLKFKEMEEQFRKNKRKQNASDKMDSDETQDSSENSDDKEESASQPDGDSSKMSDVSETSVIVGSPGTSGNVERLSD